MSKNIKLEVNSIRLEESSETPILLLLDPSSQKVLPIWIGTIEAVSIAYAQEGILHDRPQTHDLLLNIVEALDASINEVNIVLPALYVVKAPPETFGATSNTVSTNSFLFI